MSEVAGALETLKDDDILLIFRVPTGHVRRRAERTTWGAVTRAVLAKQPTVAGPKGDPGRDGAAGLNGKDGAAGTNGTNGTNGKDGAAGKDGVGPKPDRFTGAVAGSSGVATILFGKTYGTVYPGQVVTTWVGNQMVTGTVTSTLADRATVAVRISVATVLIGGSPFGIAPAGTPVTIEVFGF